MGRELPSLLAGLREPGKYHVTALKIYRDLNAPEDLINVEVSNLMKFIHTRSMQSNITYIVLAYSEKGVYSSYLLLLHDDVNVLGREAEIIKTYVNAHLKSIDLKILKNIKPKMLIPLPSEPLFFR